ncbi:ANTAR domain-containing protein [Nocardia stercoris]|uniref:ANTAR domain-containing protein n=1 Tax=Nocardia stercoris TaxID=2483361 RepID=UPI001F3E97F8|nr:ANTAR domain-containing protein [Nocardia stercoris]
MSHRFLHRQVPDLVESRASIEQAKGVLIRIYGISADQAFKVLVWLSQESNTRVRDLAEQLMAELPRLPVAQDTTVAAFDHILLTLHERIPH